MLLMPISSSGWGRVRIRVDFLPLRILLLSPMIILTRLATMLVKMGFGGGSEIAALYFFIHACSASSTIAILGLGVFIEKPSAEHVPELRCNGVNDLVIASEIGFLCSVLDKSGRVYREAPGCRLRQIKGELSRLTPKPRENGHLSGTSVELNGWVVSAAGLEPATHALKGHCSTN